MKARSKQEERLEELRKQHKEQQRKELERKLAVRYHKVPRRRRPPPAALRARLPSGPLCIIQPRAAGQPHPSPAAARGGVRTASRAAASLGRHPW